MSIEALKAAFENLKEEGLMAMPHTMDGGRFFNAEQVIFFNLAKTMMPDLIKAITVIGDIYEADNRVFETDDEGDERAEDLAAAISEGSELIAKLKYNVVSKEGHIVLGRLKSLQYHGSNCPACGEMDSAVTVNNIQVDAENAWQDVKCNRCDFIWQDVFQLSNIDIKPSQLEIMRNVLAERNISVYKSEQHGWGFTFCESDNYLTEQDALLSAWKYGIDNNLVMVNDEW